MTSLPDDFWETRFRDNRTPWEREAINPAFTAWLDSGELAPCRILVPGAGRSPEPAELLARGFDVVALDLAPAATEDQQRRLGADRVVQADVTDWTPADRFDAVYDQTCLCALPPPLWPAYVAQLRAGLRRRGWLRLGPRPLLHARARPPCGSPYLRQRRPGMPAKGCSAAPDLEPEPPTSAPRNPRPL